MVPDRYSFVDIGEKDQENPLPWDKIDAAKYDIWEGYVGFEDAIEASKKRMSQNAQLRLIEENAKWVKSQSDDSSYPLNYAEYAREAEMEKEKLKEFDAIKDYKTDLTYSSLPYEEELFVSDTVLKEKRQRWYESLSKDVYMEEAINVLADMKMNNIKVAGVDKGKVKN